ncbi:MAG: ABC transporter substrate-binding protein [Bacteroidota bacterium]
MKACYSLSFKHYLIGCLGLLLLGACKREVTHMRFTSWQSSPTEEKVIRSILTNFDKKYPELDYKYEPIPGNYSEKIQLMLGTHTAPDLFWLKGYTSPSYLSFEVLKSLDSYIVSDEDFDNEDIFPVFRNAFYHKGKCYGIAKDFNVYVLFYNTKLFEAAGIEAPPADWQELYDISQKLTQDTDGNGKIDQYGLVIEPVHEMLMPFVFQNGGEFHDEEGNLKLTEPAFIEATEFYLKLYKDGVATIPTDMGAGWNGDVMGRQQAAMCISGAWAIPYFQEQYPDLEYKVAILPKGKQRATLAFATAFVIGHEAPYPDEAWELLSYMTGKEGMREWTESGIALPTRKSVAEENGFYEHPIYGTFMESVDFSYLYQIKYMERWSDEMVASMQAMFYRNAPVRESLEKLESRISTYKLK